MSHDIRAWAAEHACKIDENGLLHVYKAVHKVNTKNGPRYISDYAVAPSLLHAGYGVGLYRKACKQDIIEYTIGRNVEIDLLSLNTDPFEDCGSGLHFGSHLYAAEFEKVIGKNECFWRLGGDNYCALILKENVEKFISLINEKY